MKKIFLVVLVEVISLLLAFAAWFSGALYGGFTDIKDTDLAIGSLIVIVGLIPLAIAAYTTSNLTKKRYWWYINAIPGVLLVGYAILLALASLGRGPWS
jgi:hypothetical protein